MDSGKPDAAGHLGRSREIEKPETGIREMLETGLVRLAEFSRPGVPGYSIPFWSQPQDPLAGDAGYARSGSTGGEDNGPSSSGGLLAGFSLVSRASVS